jgi:hypothetical protein
MLVRQHQLLEALTAIRDAASYQADPNSIGMASDPTRSGAMPAQDSKKRRGVSSSTSLNLLTFHSVLLPLEDAIAATAPRHLNGDGAQTELGRFVMLADYVRQAQSLGIFLTLCRFCKIRTKKQYESQFGCVDAQITRKA